MFEKKILKLIIQHQDIEALDAVQSKEDILFQDTKEVYDAVNQYYKKFSKIPDFEYLREFFELNKSDAYKMLREVQDEDIKGRLEALPLIENELQIIAKNQAVMTTREFGNKFKKDGASAVEGHIRELQEHLADLSAIVTTKEPKQGLLYGDKAKERFKKYYATKKSGDSHYVGKFGIDRMDEVFGGFTRYDYMSVLGNVNQGKSPFMRQMAYEMIMQGLNVMFVTLEMDRDTIEQSFYTLHANNYKKFGSNLPRITTEKVKTGKLTKKEEKFFFDTALDDFVNSEELGSLYVLQPEDDLYTMDDMLADITRVHKTVMPLDALFVDYATLLIPTKKTTYVDNTMKNLMLQRLRKFQLAFDKGRGLFVCNAVQSNRKGFEDMLSHKDHLYSITAIGDFNSVERDSTMVVSIARTPEDEAARLARIQCLKSRESKKFMPFTITLDGETGAFHQTVLEMTDDEIVEELETLNLDAI